VGIGSVGLYSPRASVDVHTSSDRRVSRVNCWRACRCGLALQDPQVSSCHRRGSCAANSPHLSQSHQPYRPDLDTANTRAWRSHHRPGFGQKLWDAEIRSITTRNAHLAFLFLPLLCRWSVVTPYWCRGPGVATRRWRQEGRSPRKRRKKSPRRSRPSARQPLRTAKKMKA